MYEDFERTTTTTTTAAATGSSSTTTNKKESTQEAIHALMIDIRAQYFDAIGRGMPRMIAQECQQLMMNYGIIAGYWIQYALGEAAAAPRPSWAYARAIIRRQQREHGNLQLLY